MDKIELSKVCESGVSKLTFSDYKIAVIGLGYVGLPLAHAFSEKYEVVGFDISLSRIKELVDGFDRTLELSNEQIKKAVGNDLQFTCEANDIAECNVFIVTVPTPIDKHKKPDLTPLIKASELVAKVLKQDDIVVYESTVYPGVVEEECAFILEKISGLQFNEGFYCGYSPERVNPGDKKNTLTEIVKITSGSTPEVADIVDALYHSIITVGTCKVSAIKIAEAAKVIENIQRDVNIALINELAIIFNKLNIDTEEVLKAAGTKWNFLPFRPGLVGGHCIGVDPYYLAHKALEVGCHPEIILTGRRLNDRMGRYVAEQVLKLMAQNRIQIIDSNVLVMGFSFKENCPDIRNTRVIDLVKELKCFNCNVDVYDPWVDKQEVQEVFGFTPVDVLENGSYDAIILSVAHDEFKKMGAERISELGKVKYILYDVKFVFSVNEVTGRL